MGNEGEFFGLAAKIRGYTSPLNRQYPWLRYALAVISIAAFAVLMRTTGSWSWIVVVGWLLIGILWFQVFSRWRDFWWGRKRGFTFAKDLFLNMSVIGLILIGAFAWPLWMALGEDIFD